MALAGAPRLILFDEPAAGLSPAERRELVALLTALPRAHGLRHHRARPRHRAARRRARHRDAQRPRAKHGTPGEIESDAEVQAIYMGRPALMAGSRAGATKADRGPILRVERLDVYYGRAHALQDVSPHARPRRARPWSAATAWARRRCATRSPGWCRRPAACGSPARRSSACRPTRSPVAASATCRRAGACGRRSRSTSTCAWLARRDAARGRSSASTQMFPRLAERKRQRRRRAVRRRAADARDRPRAAVQPAPAGDGRAHRGPGAGDRRAGRATC